MTNKRQNSVKSKQTKILQFFFVLKGLIEDFIEGDEYTVLVLANIDNPQEPFVLDPVKIEFGAGESFKHFELKNISYEGFGAGTAIDETLKARLTLSLW